MKILHTEASPGWGGQELRILSEAEGMRKRGHQVIFAIQTGGGLVEPARKKGFLTYEIDYKKKRIFHVFYQLMRLIRQHEIEIVNTHSSLDAWIGGCVGKVSGCLVIRTRHLSTPIRTGMNSYLLYNLLAHYVVTTCEETMEIIRVQAKLSQHRCFSVPTGIDPMSINFDPEVVAKFRVDHGVGPEDCLAGTLCVLRGWKGVSHFLLAAKLLENIPNLKWMVVGSGVSEHQFKKERELLGLEDKVIFTGHLYPPFTALAAMDIFFLLSWANEGVSQASLQAAWLEKPLITTPIGGLREVCIDRHTGLQVPIHDPQAVAEATLKLMKDKELRKEYGKNGKRLVMQKFTLSHTLEHMENIYLLRHKTRP